MRGSCGVASVDGGAVCCAFKASPCAAAIAPARAKKDLRVTDMAHDLLSIPNDRPRLCSPRFGLPLRARSRCESPAVPATDGPDRPLVPGVPTHPRLQRPPHFGDYSNRTPDDQAIPGSPSILHFRFRRLMAPGDIGLNVMVSVLIDNPRVPALDFGCWIATAPAKSEPLAGVDLAADVPATPTRLRGADARGPVMRRSE